MALAIDGTPVVGTDTGGSSLTLTYASVSAGSILVVMAGSERVTSAAAHATISVSSATLGSFSKRADGSIDGVGQSSAFSYAGYWWACAPNALTNEIITIEFSTTIDDAAGMAFAVSGFTGTAYQTNPWDQNASLGQASLTTATILTTPHAAAISTTNANTMLLGICLGPFSGNLLASSPFTAIGVGNVKNSGGTNQFSGAMESNVVSTTQTSLAVQIGDGSAVDTWMMWADALSESGSGSSSPTDDRAFQNGAVSLLLSMRERASGLLEPVRELWKPKKPKLFVPGFSF